jgi:hypothetical protein
LSNHGEAVVDPIVEVKVAREIDDLLCYQTSTRDAGANRGVLSRPRHWEARTR